MPIVIDSSPMVKITVDELREACQSNPNHYLVHAYQRAVHLRKPGRQMVTVAEADLQALQEGKRVCVVTEIREVDGEEMHVTYKELTDLPPDCKEHKYTTRRPKEESEPEEVPPTQPMEEPLSDPEE